MNKKLAGGIVRFAAQLAAFIALIVFFAREDFSFAGNLFWIVGGSLLMIPVTVIGRKALDENPARIAEITMAVQALRISLFGAAVTRAIKTADAWTMGLVLPIPQSIGFAILAITGAALFFTFLNLAVGGLGAPAFSESVKLTKDWLYSKMRNPMVLAVFLWFISWGLYLQSAAFVLWVLVLVIPVEVFFEKHYEERELEIRFGESYLRYKAVTPFMFPRIALPRLLGKTMATVTSKHLILLVLAGSLFIPEFAFATDWTPIPRSKGSAYIDTGSVYGQEDIISFWFLAKRVKLDERDDKFAQSLEKRPDAWTYQGKPFSMSIRKVEVDMSKTPRLTRSVFAMYFDADGKQVGETETTKGEWAPESGPRLWTDLLWLFFGKKGSDTGAIPALLASK